MRRMNHVKKLDDVFGMFLVKITCGCGFTIEKPAKELAEKVGWQCTLEDLAKKLKCSSCGAKSPEVFAVPEPRPRGRGLR